MIVKTIYRVCMHMTTMCFILYIIAPISLLCIIRQPTSVSMTNYLNELLGCKIRILLSCICAVPNRSSKTHLHTSGHTFAIDPKSDATNCHSKVFKNVVEAFIYCLQFLQFIHIMNGKKNISIYNLYAFFNVTFENQTLEAVVASQ